MAEQLDLDFLSGAPLWIVRPPKHDTQGFLVRAFTRDAAIAEVGRGEPELCMLVDEFDAMPRPPPKRSRARRV